jgi:hypothetical protein
MDETAGISLAGSVRAIARVERGPTAQSGRVRPRIRKRALRDEITKGEFEGLRDDRFDQHVSFYASLGCRVSMWGIRRENVVRNVVTRLHEFAKT